MRRPSPRALPAALVALLAVSCARSTTGGHGAAGHGPGDAAGPRGSAAAPTEGPGVDIAMVDTAFEPEQVTVPSGVPVRFRFTNLGSLAHEAFPGDARAQAEHAAEMAAGAAEHEGHGPAGEGLRLEPGESATLTHAFATPGRYEIGCHEPGHYDSGMRVVVTVTDG